MTKQELIDLLYAFANQRPGLEFGNYGDVSSYRSELRGITRDLQEARLLLRAVELRNSISVEDLQEALKRAFSGRLSLTETKDGKPALYYCSGQYFPTEYRKAVCAVCAYALWHWMREGCMPAPKIKHYGSATNHPMQTVELYDGLNAGEWLRKKFRREFGRGVASRWFN
jgi:hypothetical protein